MATVYRARDVRHERDVAIKVLSAALAESIGTERFLAEIRTTANLRHPHILPLYDSGIADGLLFYVMPLVEGETLRTRLDREKQLPLTDALRIAEEVGEALEYAHGRQVIHRDIKPENILLEGGHAIVADFGIARAVNEAGGERLTQTGMSLGTPSYMSPEQAAGDTGVDCRSDQYSLACVLYEMLGGQPPFTGATAATIVRQHIAVEAPPVTNLRPDVPAPVDRALRRALAKSPVDRYESIGDFVRAPGALPEKGAPTEGALTVRTTRRRLVPAIAIAVLAVLTLGELWVAGRRPAASSPTLAGVAVLPFTDLSADQSNAYLGDGIAETLISALTNVPGLTVAARGSAFSFRDREVDVREIGRALSVGTVMEGSVQRAGEQLRITAKLVQTSDGVALWSQTFDRKADDIFAVQDEVVRAVVTALQGQLFAERSDFSADVGTADRAAYELYLQGMFYWNRRSIADFQRALGFFDRAIERDSAYAAPWSGIAYTLLAQAFVDTTSALVLLPRARTAAERALALAPDQADGHVALAYLLLLQDWDFAASDSAFREVVTRFPGNVAGHHWYADLLAVLGRKTEAEAQLRQALALDPRSAIVMFNLGFLYFKRDQMDTALLWFDRSLTLAPDLALSLLTSAEVHGQRGDSAKTLAALERYAEVSTKGTAPIADLRRAWGRGGYPAVLRAQADAPGSRSQPYDRAQWLARIGEFDAAFEALDQTLTRREVFSAFTATAPAFAPMHDDPRWSALMQRLGLQ